ncbi:UNVERIFIED_CONTAM: hypothetical protein K2H54_038797 [Gekko kuhli]
MESQSSTFICNTHIIPVKNQDGVAMMFIINFEYVTDEENVESPEKFNQILSAKVTNQMAVPWTGYCQWVPVQGDDGSQHLNDPEMQIVIWPTVERAGCIGKTHVVSY